MPTLTAAQRAHSIQLSFTTTPEKLAALRKDIEDALVAAKLEALGELAGQQAEIAEAARLIGLEDAVKHLEEYIERAEKDAERAVGADADTLRLIASGVREAKDQLQRKLESQQLSPSPVTPARESVDVERGAVLTEMADVCSNRAENLERRADKFDDDDSKRLERERASEARYLAANIRSRIGTTAPPRDSSPAASGEVDSLAKVRADMHSVFNAKDVAMEAIARREANEVFAMAMDKLHEWRDVSYSQLRSLHERVSDIEKQPRSSPWDVIGTSIGQKPIPLARDSSAAESGPSVTATINSDAPFACWKCWQEIDESKAPRTGRFTVLSHTIKLHPHCYDELERLAHPSLNKWQAGTANAAPPTPAAPEATPGSLDEFVASVPEWRRKLPLNPTPMQFAEAAYIRGANEVCPEGGVTMVRLHDWERAGLAAVLADIEARQSPPRAPISTDEGERHCGNCGRAWTAAHGDDNGCCWDESPCARRAPAPEAERLRDLLRTVEEACAKRVETGAFRFGEDWPGVFIRGDSAVPYSFELSNILRRAAVPETSSLWELARTLASCDMRRDSGVCATRDPVRAAVPALLALARGEVKS